MTDACELKNTGPRIWLGVDKEKADEIKAHIATLSLPVEIETNENGSFLLILFGEEKVLVALKGLLEAVKSVKTSF